MTEEQRAPWEEIERIASERCDHEMAGPYPLAATQYACIVDVVHRMLKADDARNAEARKTYEEVMGKK